MIFFSCFTFSCRKFDIQNEKFTVDRERFFSLPENASPTLQRIVANLKHQDLQKAFVDNFILSQGYPIWKHAKITIKTGNYNSVLPENDTLVSIPIVEDGKEYVKSILAVKVNTDVWYKLLEGIKYKEFLSPETASPGETFTVMDLLKMFMEMEYDIFSQSNFVIIDEEILEHSIRYGEGGGHNYGTQLGLSANGCAVFNWGYYYSGGDFNTLESEEVCINNTSELIYTLYPAEPGGGGVTYENPVDDEECKRGFVGIKNFDENNQPIIPCMNLNDTIKYPCDIALAEAGKLDDIYNDSNLDSIFNTIPDFSLLEVEKGLVIFQKFTVNNNNNYDTSFGGFQTSSIITGTDRGIQMNYVIPRLTIERAAAHSHHKNGYTAPSAEDIYTIIKKKKANKDFVGSFILAFNGEKFALTITDWEKANNFLNTEENYLDGDKWKEDSEIGKEFKDAYEYLKEGKPSKKHIAYETAMAAVLSTYNTGITLNKMDSNRNFRPIVIKTTIPKVSKPRKKVYSRDCI